jgi:hypothetical protein
MDDPSLVLLVDGSLKDDRWPMAVEMMTKLIQCRYIGLSFQLLPKVERSAMDARH